MHEIFKRFNHSDNQENKNHLTINDLDKKKAKNMKDFIMKMNKKKETIIFIGFNVKKDNKDKTISVIILYQQYNNLQWFFI